MQRQRRRPRRISQERSYIPPIFAGGLGPLFSAIARSPSSTTDATLVAERDAAVQTLDDRTQEYLSHMQTISDTVGADEYKRGHWKGWKTAETLAGDRGRVIGMNDGFRAAIGGENYVMFDKANPTVVTTAPDFESLVSKMPKDDPRYRGFEPGYFAAKSGKPIKDLSKYSSSYFTVLDDITILDLKKVRERTHNNKLKPGETVPDTSMPGRHIDRFMDGEPNMDETRTTLEPLMTRIYTPPDPLNYVAPDTSKAKTRSATSARLIMGSGK